MIVDPLRRLFRLDTGRRDVRAEVDDELRFHFESTVAELVAEGLPEAAAREEAERRCGSLARARDELVRIDSGREEGARRVERLAGVWQDLRLAARGFAREPVFALTVAVTLALGIGANITMVGLVDRLLFRAPAHVRGADRLAQLSLTETHPTYGPSTNTGLAWPDYALASRLPAFSGTAAFYTSRLTLGSGLEASRVRVTMATASFFPLLGVEPIAGRFYTADEDRIGAGAPVVVLSERFWRGRFGGDPGAIGATLRLGNGTFTVIGVAPRGFTGIELDRVDAWLPVASGAPEMLGPSTEWASTRNWQWVRVIGRLAPGVDRAAAATALTTTYRLDIAGDAERSGSTFAFDLHGIHPGAGPEAPRSTRITGWLAAVSFAVLLIACANVANLLLARGERRRREIAVRLALGVRRARLVRQLLLETGLLAAAGGVLSLAVVQWGGVAIRRFLLPNIDWVGAPVDGRAALLAAAVSALTILAAGLVPALRSSRADLAESLKAGGAAAGRDPGGTRLRRSLLVTQTALSVVLLMGAGLFVRSLRSVVSLDLGFEPRRVLVADAYWAERGVDWARRAELANRLEETLRGLPGVAGVAQGIAVPFQTRYSTRLRLPGRDTLPVLPTGTPSYSGVSPGYFATLGMRLARGRDFTERDREGAAPVMVVNETMARTFWPGGDAIGECVMIGGDPEPPCATVVGVVADSRREELVERPTMQYFVPVAQSAAMGLSGDRSLFLRAAGDADLMVEPARRAILAAAPELAWASVTPMERFLEPHVQPWRLGAGVFAIFGLLALVVAAVGLYGGLAYSVASRAREFGVRGALGASEPDLVRQVVGEGIRLAAIGIAIGLGIGLAAGRFIAALLFETSPGDPAVVALVAAALLVTAAAASLVPALRAARVAPADSLRAE